MKKIIKLNESDLRRIVTRVIKEHDENIGHTGEYFALGGFYFYVDNTGNERPMTKLMLQQEQDFQVKYFFYKILHQ